MELKRQDQLKEQLALTTRILIQMLCDGRLCWPDDGAQALGQRAEWEGQVTCRAVLGCPSRYPIL